jgi:hypothetical protein
MPLFDLVEKRMGLCFYLGSQLCLIVARAPLSLTRALNNVGPI